MSTESEQELRTRLNAEAAKIPWRELQRHYARGVVILVDTQMDLIEVAVKMAMDDQAAVEQWRAQEKIQHASDDNALEWLRRDAILWAVVAAPWVLVQEQACRITEPPRP